MKQTAKRFSSLLLAMGFIVVAFIVFFDLLQPAYANLETAKSQELSQDNFISNEQQIVSQVKSLISSYASQSAGQQSVGMALPSGENLAGALAQIYGLASADNIAVKNIGIAVQAPQPQAATAPSSAVASSGGGQIAQAAAGGSIVKGVGIINLQITAEGSYEGFKSFLHGLETNIRIFDMKSFSIQQSSLAFGKAVNPDNFIYNIGVATYYQSVQ